VGTLRSLLAHAVQHLWCSLFIVDLLPLRDKKLGVDGILQELDAAVWRGVDTRLLVGGSRTNFTIAHIAELARARALELGVPCRWLTSKNVRGSHMKLVIADEYVLTGSHNWSAGAFGGRQTQDSILIASADFAAYASRVFARQWARAG
jgi:phosphatidylserine/phosphatidylglycerophosphate/cardiolipin synthase-like enzyme